MIHNKIVYIMALFFVILSCSNCSEDDSNGNDPDPDDDNPVTGDYSGTASVTQGLASTTVDNLFSDGQRVAGVGTVTADDNSVWTVPAEVNYDNSSFPFAPDLHNTYGTQYATAAEALASFDDNNIVEVDADGEVITGYIFADNYFELYVNGLPVGKDAVPFTEFNSHIVKFRVSLPFTIAMKLVDWEENLGLGTETNQGSDYYPGDGGMVAVFKDASQNTIATTGSEWKAQTFYTAPIKDLGCPSESGTTRSSANCDTDSENDGSSFYALHWEIPETWMNEDFDDADWPNATTYTNETIVVNNKPSYMSFTDVFDDTEDDAEFIWSTNVILDNEVIVRYTVE
ncbi:hypothetical protein [Tunicatimonas pelagia]|uniref:hypothetical protein n=1 Tax=Tunicatimonas pelagia TaxID=931531 RepID=UPI002665F821|nr:hypothetical protein [Tunicatimonas pelagia]WKN42752.1 hypothetical protein P0M28_27320 [Tunicatimonas pelagia]